jgi:hypothetical protein
MSNTESDVDNFVPEKKCLNQSLTTLETKTFGTVSGEIVWWEGDWISAVEKLFGITIPVALKDKTFVIKYPPLPLLKCQTWRLFSVQEFLDICTELQFTWVYLRYKSGKVGTIVQKALVRAYQRESQQFCGIL